MKTFIGLLLSMGVLASNAQTEEKGIVFVKGLTWQQVLEKAKTENKYIFADVYATWCGPCKRMDAEVYPTDKAGEAANERFVSIRIQQDKTAADSADIKAWYHQADSLCNVFGVRSLPTLLFFSPDGKLITHRAGFNDVDSLVALINSVQGMKPEEWEAAEKGRKEQHFYEGMKGLALEAKELGHGKIADSLAELYINGYLYGLDDSGLFTKDNVSFITGFPELTRSGDRFFRYLLLNPKAFDQLTQEGYAASFSKYIVTKEEIAPRLFAGGKPITTHPDWEKIRSAILKKYGHELARSLTGTAAQIGFYRKMKDWKQYAALINAAIKKYPPQTDGHVFANETMTGAFFQRDDWNLNSSAWDVFLHCKDPEVLKMALAWSDLSINISGKEGGVDATDQYLDTKSNLLYKLGEVKEAITVEQQAFDIARARAEKAGQKGGGDGYLETIGKMKKGEPTWSVK